jgi:branched-chain amino acid aminotransferase
VKSLNYMNSILARWEAIEAGVDEAIMLDTRGFVSEATAENVFIVRKGRLATPSTNSAILHGVTREKVLEIGQALGYEASEREITPFELINADEVFLTGTLAEIVPVVKVNGRIIGTGKVGPVTAKIYGEFVKVRTSPDEGSTVFAAEKNC